MDGYRRRSSDYTPKRQIVIRFLLGVGRGFDDFRTTANRGVDACHGHGGQVTFVVTRKRLTVRGNGEKIKNSKIVIVCRRDDGAFGGGGAVRNTRDRQSVFGRGKLIRVTAAER